MWQVREWMNSTYKSKHKEHQQKNWIAKAIAKALDSDRFLQSNFTLQIAGRKILLQSIFKGKSSFHVKSNHLTN